MAPTLLSLPREIRDAVYLHLINDQRVQPPKLACPGERIWHGDIAYPKRYSSWRYPALVWVNRQIRNEYFEFIEAQSTIHRRGPELDIMSRGYLYFPTWLFLPPDMPGEVPFDLIVHLRVFSTEAYHSNDGWPKQPGAGFRSLMKMLNQFIHCGPSFGHHLELMRGWLFRIDTLKVNVSFHDDYTANTWPVASHQIFKLLKGLALDGVTGDMIRRIHAHTEYEQKRELIVYDRIWDVCTEHNYAKAKQWRADGFLGAYQKHLGCDYRSDWDDRNDY